MTVLDSTSVQNEMMTYKATKNRYQLYKETSEDLDGLTVRVSDGSGNCSETPIH